MISKTAPWDSKKGSPMRHLLLASSLLFIGGAPAAAHASPAVATAMAPTAPMVAQATDREEEDRRRRSQTLSTRTGQRLQDALNFANSEPPQYQDALNVLNSLVNNDLNPFDLSTVLEIRASVYFQLERVDNALNDFVRVLELDALPFDRLTQIRFNVAQLYFQEENYAATIRMMREYLQGDDVENANAWFILAAAYVQQDQYRQALEPAQNMLRYDTENRRNYYDLMNLIFSELDMRPQRIQLLEQMIEFFPSNEPYWTQLSGLYSVSDRTRDAFAVLEVAYKAGLIEEEDKIVVLAQYYSELDNPFRGAQLLEQEMDAGVVTRDLDNLRLLGQLWSMAREQSRAIEALSAAARMSDDGELYYRIGQSYMADEEFQLALDNFAEAESKGGLTAEQRGDIALLRGSAIFSLRSETAAGRREARQAFTQAANYNNTRRSAQGWIGYIDAIEQTLAAQDRVERAQAEERRRRERQRCETIIDVAELGGDVTDETLQECRDLLAQLEAEESGEGAEEAAPEAG